MNCANHPDVPAVAFCRTCGKPLCSSCVRDVQGVVYCESCLAAHLSGAMPPPGAGTVLPVVDPAANLPRPGVALALGFIPGVGAMYNGEFAKGFIHVLIFATLIWMSDNVSGIFGLGIAAFVVYMPIEAYRTAKARLLGLPAPDPFGFNNWFSSAPPPVRPVAGTPVGAVPPPMGAAYVVPPMSDAAGVVPPVDPESFPDDEGRSCRSSRVPIGAVIMIAIGVLFLLDELGALHFDWIWRFWPLILIAIGVRVLIQRQRRGW